MGADSQQFKSITERDIDLLLLEELTVIPEFRYWFLNKLGLTFKEQEFINSWHSVTDSQLGESDIEFGFVSTDGDDCLIMIENKIDAPFQKNQLQRYRLRGEKALSGEWDRFFTILVAPDRYSDQTESEYGIDALVTYEQIRDWFAQRGSQRDSFKIKMIEEAIEQERRGYTSEPDEQVTQLHQHYWDVVQKDFPSLKMDKPTGAASGNLWIRFKIQSLPDDVKLRHKMGKGHVDLAFRGTSERSQEFKEQYQSRLEQNMYIDSSGNSMFVRTSVPTISAEKPPKEQENKIRTGLEAASQLLNWYNNRNMS